ncbi:MAG: dicarboxylate/amino acid:cation symporter [Acidaminococcaceae bacterium]|nr:dicarboxylate/amino acid:cation symporter [Acidaminococcaceae bacterium]
MGFLLQIVFGMVSGVIVGIILGPEHTNFINAWIVPIGTIFLRLLKLIIVPLVVSSLIVGVTGLGDIRKFGRIGGKTFALYMLTTVFAVGLGMGIGVIFEPGVGLNLHTSGQVALKEMPSISEMIINIFPSNPIQSMVEENMMQLIVFSMAVGIGVLACGEKAKLIADFVGQVAKICYKVVGVIMKVAPLGVFALIVPVVAVNGTDVFMPLISIIVCFYLAILLHGIIVYGGLLKFIVRINPFKYIKKVFPAVAFAFSSCSSGATLPVSITYCRWMNISREVASFVLPLGATINMDGTAIYLGLGAVFIAQVYGIEFFAFHYLYIAFMSTMISIGASGIPGLGIILLTMISSAMGLPLEGVALIAGIDRIMDMGHTALNVTGDMVVCGVIAKSEGETLNV